MSRRKQAKPQQVDRENNLNQPTTAITSIEITPNKLSTLDREPGNSTSLQACTTQTQNESSKKDIELILLSRQTRENKAENFAFFPAGVSDKPSMADETNSVSAESAAESLKSEEMEKKSDEASQREDKTESEILKEIHKSNQGMAMIMEKNLLKNA